MTFGASPLRAEHGVALRWPAMCVGDGPVAETRLMQRLCSLPPLGSSAAAAQLIIIASRARRRHHATGNVRAHGKFICIAGGRLIGSEIDFVLGFEATDQMLVSGFLGYFLPGRAFAAESDNALIVRIKFEFGF